MIGAWLRILLLLLAVSIPGSLWAQQGRPPADTPTAAPAALSPAEARHAIEVLQDPQKRAELIRVLEAIAKAAPAPAPAGAAPAAPAAVSLAPGSIGAELMAQFSGWGGRVAAQTAAAVKAATDFPLAVRWATRIVDDPAQRNAALYGVAQIALILACALLVEWLAGKGLAWPAAALAAHAPAPQSPAPQPPALQPPAPQPPARPNSDGPPAPPPDGAAWHLLRRLPFALARLGLALIPVAVFWGLASALAGIVDNNRTRLAALELVNAYAIARILTTVGGTLASPGDPRLRLVQVDETQAGYLLRWLRRLVLTAVFGCALADLALLFGLNEGAYDTLMRVVALIVAILAGVVVLQCRAGVAQRLRPPPAARGVAARWRNWLAGSWHYLALIGIVAGWILWAAGIRNGIGGLRVLLGTVAILVAARLVAILLLGALDRIARPNEGEGGRLSALSEHMAGYHAIARAAVIASIVFATAILLLQFWGANAFLWFAPGRFGAQLLSAAATITVAAIAAIVVWEGANAALERRLAQLSEAGSAAHSARLRTLLPMLRAALFCTIVAIVGLTALSEIGVNIAPLLAGAGIVGVAVGFGSQKLVQDVITGMFVLFENAIQIGDWVTVAGLSGNVEQLSVRNICLRGSDGAVHIVPFSAVTTITNTNRGVGNAAVSVTVAYQEDTDRIAALLRDIVAEMRGAPDLAPLILGELQLWVDAVKATGVTLSGQIPCSDAGRWTVQHEFNRRMQQRFRELGIELAG